VLSACNVDSNSAIQVRGLDVLSKILESDLGFLGACWVGERVAGGASGVEVGREGSIIIHNAYARRPVCLTR
jgi:hypothetical protein